MQSHRQQLTLFVINEAEAIEQIRARFNPVQYGLIPAHVTLCREEEIAELDLVIVNLKTLVKRQTIRIEFDPPETFADGKGLLLPAKPNVHFEELRRKVLKDTNGPFNRQMPHITLMHPRNSTCTADVFGQVKKMELPLAYSFDKVSLIEQHNGGLWTIIAEFPIGDAR